MDLRRIEALERPAPIRIGECASLLRVPRSTVRRFANSGLLPHCRSPGFHRLFDRSLVELVAAEADGQKTLPMEVSPE